MFDAAFTKVFGVEHSGRVQAMGFGVTPTKYFGPSLSEGHSSQANMQGEQVATKAELQQLATQMDARFNALFSLLAQKENSH